MSQVCSGTDQKTDTPPPPLHLFFPNIFKERFQACRKGEILFGERLYNDNLNATTILLYLLNHISTHVPIIILFLDAFRNKHSPKYYSMHTTKTHVM